jgi:hypothetical protein
VDMIKFSGPVFTGVDNRLMALQLVEQWLAPSPPSQGSPLLPASQKSEPTGFEPSATLRG